MSRDTFRDRMFGSQWVSGGVSTAPAVRQTFGKYEVRMRIDSGYGVAGAVLLWPSTGRWPPGIDFWENDGTDTIRSQMTATLHCGRDNRQIQRSVNADLSRWHTLGLGWRLGVLAFLLDGQQWATVTGAAVPTIPMVLDIQYEVGTCGSVWLPCPNATTPTQVRLQVAWVRIYAYRPGAPVANGTGR